MREVLTRICRHRGDPADLPLLRSLCDMLKATSLCGLGQSAPNPVLSTLKYFEHEYHELIDAAARKANGVPLPVLSGGHS
jgi:bidirectional [NiFe] hydrogenase diaphorase subunit